ncbi:hypothetical protein D3C79_937710 [compost metagenome]
MFAAQRLYNLIVMLLRNLKRHNDIDITQIHIAISIRITAEAIVIVDIRTLQTVIGINDRHDGRTV